MLSHLLADSNLDCFEGNTLGYLEGYGFDSIVESVLELIA
jgi:hypothetical protein